MNRNRFKRDFGSLRFADPSEKQGAASPEDFPPVADYYLGRLIEPEVEVSADPKDKDLFDLEAEFIEYLQWHQPDNYKQLSETDHQMLSRFFEDADDFFIPHDPKSDVRDFLRAQERRMRFLLENEPKPRQLFPLEYYDHYNPRADLVESDKETVISE